MNIYVGNLAWNASEEDLSDLFGQYGTVDRANIIMDRETGRSRGFAFVEMPDQGEGQAAIDGLNDTEAFGRNLKVNEARPRQERPSRGRY